MKKMFASLACAALLITALTGCGQKTGSTRTPEELTQLYSQAITESGGEMVEYNPVITQIDDENEINGMILESMGLKAEYDRLWRQRFHDECEGLWHCYRHAR